MHFSAKLISFLATTAYFVKPLVAAPAPDAVAEAFPEPLAEAFPEAVAEVDVLAQSLPVSEIEARAAKKPITRNICVGDSAGTKAAFWSCVNVVWDPSKRKAVVKHTVKDSRGDSKGTYGRYKVYWADKKIEQSSRLNNNKGVGKTVSAKAKTWTRNEFITGIRVQGCVNNRVGKDTCRDVFSANPFS